MDSLSLFDCRQFCSLSFSAFCPLPSAYWFSRPKPLAVFGRRDKCLHHFRTHEVAVELIQLRQPEIVASVICIGSIVRVTTQVTEELHQDKRPVEFLLIEN